MIVCICYNVSAETIKQYKSLPILQEETGAGTDCKGCLCYLEELLDEDSLDSSVPNAPGANK